MPGNLMLKKPFMNINTAINLEHNLPNGTYTVLIQIEIGSELRKLVVIR